MPNPPSSSKPRYAGLLPKKGWPQRNYRFFRHRVIPQVVQARDGERKAPVLHPPAQGSARITWIGHASFLVQYANHSLIIDPNWALWHGLVKRQREPGLELDLIPLVDLVLITHAHFDHLHKKSLKVIDSKEGIIVPRGSGNLVKRLGFHAVHEMKVWDQLVFNELEVVHTPSHHWGARYLHDTHRDYGGYLVKADGLNIFHCGDSAYYEEFVEIGKRERIDIALMPIGAYDAPSGRDVHMNPEEAVQAFLDLGASVLIPMHYGTFPLGNEPYDEPVERLLAEADRRGVLDKVLVLAEGVGVEVDADFRMKHSDEI
ncbi:MBL fold metallo-hydrolase [Persicirhabdus sediminis]|uniref:MBL fold metallo-hydrolase n=1 Tax=Persicirhabdus sediminis TaxID=454144 RepID=A0A8J7MD06_9BACT|nr:MBL fold metallo-hydrolase [Persicirhabdus sediminis]MBK1791484.1 MBL fold metallo-hydrolase [Persicirhabdus sediminis]